MSYRLFGLTVASSFPFTFHLLSKDGPEDLCFEASEPALEDADAGKGPIAYESPFPAEDGHPVLRVIRRESSDILRFPGVADFSVGQKAVLYHPAAPERLDLVEIRFLGTVLAFILERDGVPALHASAVDLGDSAVAFLGSNRGGKTGLAASFLTAGFPLLSDDVLPLEFDQGRALARPAYPQMRAWPDLAAHLVGSIDSLPRVLPELEKRRLAVGSEGGLGKFCPEPRPLAAIYLPERQPPGSPEEVRVQPIRPRDAVVELLRSSFLAHLVAALGWQPERIDFFSRLVATVPLRRLLYPSGFEHLERVKQAVLEDLVALGLHRLVSR